MKLFCSNGSTSKGSNEPKVIDNQKLYFVQKKKRMIVMKQTFKSLNIFKRYFGDFKVIMKLLGDAI
jgi:hypothetical protein